MKTARPSAADRPPPPDRPAFAAGEIARDLESLDPIEARRLTGVSTSRLPTLPAVVTLLEALIGELGPAADCGFGFRAARRAAVPRSRSGYAARGPAARRGARGRRAARPVRRPWCLRSTNGSIRCFPTTARDLQRLRLAACLLGDIAWNAHPDFRAERRSTWPFTAIGSGSTRTAARCSAAPCAVPSAAKAGSSRRWTRLLKPGESERVGSLGQAPCAWHSG